jgi:hypothetical protein
VNGIGGLGKDVRYWRDQLIRTIQRLKPVPVLVRLVLMVAVIAAGVLSAPDADVAFRSLPVMVIAAILVALAPGSLLPTFAIVMAVFGAILQTAGTAAMSLVKLLTLATALYLIHTTAALAAVLPTDSIVAPPVLARWFARAGLVIFATASIGVVVGELPGAVGQREGFLLVLLAGLALGLAVIALLIRLLRRE